MHRSLPYLARFRDLFGRFGGKKSNANKISSSEQEFAKNSKEKIDDDDETRHRRELDELRARGIMKQLESYEPPPNVEKLVVDIVRSYLGEKSFDKSENVDHYASLMNTKLDENKFVLLNLAESQLGKRIPSSYLHELTTVGDMVEFFKIPIEITTNYTNLTRGDGRYRTTKVPANLHAVEEPKRFHPLVDGETAFPGRSAYVTDLRERQFYKGYRAKKEWHEYRDKHFDYDKSPPDCPWDKKKAERYDKINFRLRPDFPW